MGLTIVFICLYLKDIYILARYLLWMRRVNKNRMAMDGGDTVANLIQLIGVDNMKYRKILVSLALAYGAIASGAALASSVTYEMGTLDSDGTSQDATPVKGTFTDFFNFTIIANSDVGTSVLNIPWTSIVSSGTKIVQDINGLTMKLFNTNGTLGMQDDTQIGASLASGALSFDALSSGNYYAIVTGNAFGTKGGKYSVQMLADPITAPNVSTVVPVPAAAWLLGSGLLGLVGVSRRKQ